MSPSSSTDAVELGPWGRFWFGELDARPIGLMRIIVGVIVAWILAERIPPAETTFSHRGWLSHEAALQLMDPWHWSLFHLYDGPVAVQLTLAVGALAALCFAAGLLTRVTGVVAFVVLASMQVRNPAVLYGADSVVRIWFFYLLLADSGAAYSIDGVRRRLARGEPGFMAAPPTLQAWPVRLFQFQVATVYLLTGINKAYGTDYHEGTALWLAVANPTYSRFFVLEPLYAALYPFLVLGTKITLYWEMALPFMVPFRRTRIVALGFGVMVHGAIFLLLDIEWWGPIMITSYLAFIEPRPLHRLWLGQLRAVRSRRWDERLRFEVATGDEDARRLARAACAIDPYGLVSVVEAPHESRLVRRSSGDEVERDAWRPAVAAVLPRGLRRLLPAERDNVTASG